MLKFAVFLAVVAYALGAVLQPPLDGRIVGGTVTTISQFPYQVSVQRNGKHACGAAIYSKDIIVTAAHCLGPIDLDALKILAGSSFCNAGGFLHDVASFKIHEKYDARTTIYDVGVIRLKLPLKFSSTIQPIPLASVEPQFGAPALISGWGMTAYGANSISTVLQYINSTAIDTETCRKPFYGYGEDIHPTMICAASAGKDACQNDSGGPMVSGGFLVGIVSWGMGCAYYDYPGVYANVAVLKNWIEDTAKTF